MQDELTNALSDWFANTRETTSTAFTSPEFYLQLFSIAVALGIAFLVAAALRISIPGFRRAAGSEGQQPKRNYLYPLRGYVFPVLGIVALGAAIAWSDAGIGQSWAVRMAQALAVVLLLYRIVSRFVENALIKAVFTWILIPLAVLYVFGWLDDFAAALEGVSLSVGNINFSLLALCRTVVFGTLLFWLGRKSHSFGQQAIRDNETFDAGTREVFAKLFQIALIVVLFLLFLQVMGVNLTALAVFGGAFGVGLAFGLQQIASNFISGIIILLDRSITIGDFIELEDGRSGTLRELNMRFGVIETFDGKDIMVPNELFITSTYTNWTHKDPQQRYTLELQVAYSTDLDLLFDNIRRICADHPSVISGDDIPKAYIPDAEIAGFGESGIDVVVEFWMEGIDDGENRVAADLYLSIWRSIQENGMEIPFPQREVRILEPEKPPV